MGCGSSKRHKPVPSIRDTSEKDKIHKGKEKLNKAQENISDIRVLDKEEEKQPEREEMKEEDVEQKAEIS